MAFRDNDSLAALLAVELKADLLVLLTDVDGLFDGPPSDPKSNFIPTYCPEVHDDLIKFGDASVGGRGGMVSKVRVCLCMSVYHLVVFHLVDCHLCDNRGSAQYASWYESVPNCVNQLFVYQAHLSDELGIVQSLLPGFGPLLVLA